jgi:hypothetical protein
MLRPTTPRLWLGLVVAASLIVVQTLLVYALTGLHMWPLSAGVTGDCAAGLCDRQRLAASGACDQGARAALIRSRAQTAPRSFGDACDRRCSRRRERRASTKSSTVSRSRDLGGRSTISAHPLTPARP